MMWDKIESIAWMSFTYPMIALIICCIVAIECIPIAIIVVGATWHPVSWGTIVIGIFFGWLIYTGTILVISAWRVKE